MFPLIPWSDFLFAILLVLFTYWLVIGLIYYRNELRSILKNGFKIRIHSVSDKQDNQDEDLFSQCNDCATKLKLFIRGEAIHEKDRNILLSQMKIIIRQHPLLVSTKWQIPVNNLIKYECKQRCSVEISDEEIRTIWMR